MTYSKDEKETKKEAAMETPASEKKEMLPKGKMPPKDLRVKAMKKMMK